MRKILTICQFCFLCSTLDLGTRAQDDSQPLFLTPLINLGDITQARELARVGQLSDSINRESYSGFITVDEETNSNLFFWFFPARESPDSAPLILWLDGGPGVTGFLSLFNQHGPWKVESDGYLAPREEDWTRNHSVIYLENPVGTGFSFTEAETGYSTSSQHAGENAYKFLQQFFKLFPEFLQNSFHIGGISYGGHFAPPLFHLIHQKNVDPEGSWDKINLSGLLLFAPWFDPINQVNYGDYLRNLGLIDEGSRAHFDRENDAIEQLIRDEMWIEAKQRATQLLSKPDSYLFNKTGFSSALSVLEEKLDASGYGFIPLVQSPTFRRALHVGNLSFDVVSPPAQRALDTDFMTSVAPSVAATLNSINQEGSSYNVTIIGGQMDLSVLHLGLEEIISGLDWPGKDEWVEEGGRGIWRVGGNVAGYTKKGGNLQYVLIRNAGHLPMADRPAPGLDLIEKITRNLPLVEG